MPWRSAAAVIGDLLVNSFGVQTSPVASASAGNALLAGGTVTVTTTRVKTTSLIFLCHQGDGGAVGFLSETKAGRVAGTSFVILSSNGGDAGHVSWLLINPV